MPGYWAPSFTGPLATGLFAVSGLSYLLCLVVSGLLYALLCQWFAEE